MKICVINECEKQVERRRKLCSMHLSRARRKVLPKRLYICKDCGIDLNQTNRYAKLYQCKLCRAIYLKANRYGFKNASEVTAFLTMHGNKCAICGATEKLHIDHDHKCCPTLPGCGKCLRGLLCNRCNWAIGYMKDDINLLAKAIEYLT